MSTIQSNNMKLPKLMLIVACSLAVQGCQDSSMRDLKDFVETAYQDEKPEIDPLPEIEPFVPFEYVSEEEGDPFSFDNVVSTRDRDSDAAPGAAGERPDQNRIKEPLEDFPLDALSMVGTLSQEGVAWVVVKTSSGTAHLASQGMYMGQNDGKITQIVPDEQRVVLEETVADPAGRWVKRNVEITIDEQ